MDGRGTWEVLQEKTLACRRERAPIPMSVEGESHGSAEGSCTSCRLSLRQAVMNASEKDALLFAARHGDLSAVQKACDRHGDIAFIAKDEHGQPFFAAQNIARGVGFTVWGHMLKRVGMALLLTL